MGAPATTAGGDFFTFNVNGTAYTAVTDGGSSTLNITTLTNTLTAWLDATLPNHSVTSNGTSITIEADNPGVAFTVTTLSSSTFSPGNVVNVDLLLILKLVGQHRVLQIHQKVMCIH